MDPSTRHVRIVAHAGSSRAGDCAIDGIMAGVETLLLQDQTFHVTWDLRASPTPSMISTAQLAMWGVRHKAALDKLTIKMGVLVSEGPMVAIIGGVLNIYAGRTPTFVSSVQAHVDAFVAAE
tara:strand:- start:213 stop:578 length:366 start_codon:yes stop_codon:yes gene_type:complete